MQIFFRILRLLLRVLLALLRRVILIRRGRILLCLNRFMVLRLTLLERELVSICSPKKSIHLLTFIIANPVATFWTACEMLSWLGEKEAADQLLDIVEDVCEKRVMTADLGGSATTIEVTKAVCDEIEAKLGKKKSVE
jgi:hypothetical protein